MRAKLNLTVPREIAEEARSLGLNMSRIAETAIAHAARAERNRRWAEENRAALDTYAKQINKDGPALTRWRQF